MIRPLSLSVSLGLLIATLASFTRGEGEPDEAFKKELEALAGTWRPVESEINGMKAPEERLKDVVMTRSADGKVVVRRGGEIVMEAQVKKLDAGKTPKQGDAEITAGENKGHTVQGIYELDGDTLRMCVALPGNDTRPTEFSAKSGSNCGLTVYKREKKEE